MRRLAILGLLAALSAGPAMSGEVVSGGAGAPPQAPLARSALDEVFPEGLPFPFERVLARLRDAAGEDAVRTALIPLGRSLQRYSAAPDYFASPRIVVAVADDRARGPDMPRLADRLYLGYVPAAAVIEAISYDEAAGRFVFQEIVGYGAPEGWRTEAAARDICLRCHQGEGPIFARPLWGETNANPAVAQHLAPLGPVFHGVPVRQAIDAPDAFDAATDRAARIAAANRLWAEGCPDAPCRAMLLSAVLRFGLNGSQPEWRAPGTALAAAFVERAGSLWPDGLADVSPDLPNRDPLATLGDAAPETVLEPDGALDPETPRALVTIWRPGAEGFEAAVREVAALLAPGDFAWLDALLQSRALPGQSVALPCTLQVAAAAGGTETRFACGAAGDLAEGFLRADGSGRIDRLAIAGAPARARVAVHPGEAGALIVEGGAPRLPDGRRIGGLALQATTLRLEIVDDLSPLVAALHQHADAGSAAFEAGPFRRRALLLLMADIIGGENG
jgi:hypothetical protein